MHYELPRDEVGNSTLFGYYVWLTQIQQGKCMQYLFENQRRHRPQFDTLTGQLGGYGSMGGVYWQYNNNWPTVSWATLDHSGNWKMSHYMVEQMNKDVLVTSYFSNNIYYAHVVNDRHDEELKGLKVTVETFLYDQRDNKSQSIHTKEVTLAANSAMQVFDIQQETLFSQSDCTIKNCFIRATALHNGKVLSQSHSWPVYSRSSILSAEIQPKLTLKFEEMSSSQVRVILTNEANDSYPSIYTSLVTNTIPGSFCSNVFFLLPSESHTAIFTAKDPRADLKQKLQESLEVLSYNDLLRYAKK